VTSTLESNRSTASGTDVTAPRTPLPPRREPRSVEELLDLEQARVQQGLELRVAELRERLGRDLDPSRLVRRHPWWSLGIAGAAGALASQPLVALLRSPARLLRGVGRGVRPLGRVARSTIIGALAVSLRAARSASKNSLEI
jgi:hypothetical protein